MALAALVAAGRDPSHRALRADLLDARRRRGPPPVRGRRRARLDDRRRGRGAGTGEARLRAGARRGRRRARSRTGSSATRWPPASASGPRPRSAARAPRSRRSRWTWRAARSATSPTRRVLVLGAGENGELTARALAERGVRRCSSPTAATTARSGSRSASAARPSASTTSRRSSWRADIVVSSTGSPHQIVGHEELALVAEQRAGRPLLLIDIAVPRDIDPSVRELAGHDPLRHGRPPARGRAQRSACARRRPRRARRDRGRGGRALRALARGPRRGPDDRRAQRARRGRSWRGCSRENEPRFESLSDADRERLAAMARAIVGRLLHEPTLRLKRSSGRRAVIRLRAGAA